MATRRPAFKTGGPSFQTPRADDVRSMQQAFDNLRERFANAETQIAFLQSVADAGVATADVKAMQTQLASLQRALNVLAAQVANPESSELQSILATDGRMRAIAQEAAHSVPAIDSESSVIANRVFRA